jgi:hypothetical protein
VRLRIALSAYTEALLNLNPVQYAYQQVGAQLPRVTDQQFDVGQCAGPPVDASAPRPAS